MRINVYSQELTDEVVELSKESNTGRVYYAAQLILHSSDKLHHPPEDDDRSAVTFWLPSSPERREQMAQAFERIASIFRRTEMRVAPQYRCPNCDGVHATNRNWTSKNNNGHMEICNHTWHESLEAQ